MLAIRAAKIAAVAAVALFATLVAFGNVTDYGTNLVFVQHVLAMDSVFPNSTITYRAITSPPLQHAAYALIIAAEALTGLLCWIGTVAMLATCVPASGHSIAPRPARSSGLRSDFCCGRSAS